MKTYSHKPGTKGDKYIAGQQPAQKKSAGPLARFEDNRPETNGQQVLQAITNDFSASKTIHLTIPNMNELLSDTRDLARIWDLYRHLVEDRESGISFKNWQRFFRQSDISQLFQTINFLICLTSCNE